MDYSVVSSSAATLEMDIRNSISESLDRRTSGPCNLSSDVNLSKDYDGAIFSKKYADIVVLLLIVSFYDEYFVGFSEYLIYEVNYYLEKNCLFPELCSSTYLVKNKYSLLFCLISYTKYDSVKKLQDLIRDHTTIVRTLSSIRLKYISSRKPRRLIRHKGYRDHGSLRREDHWIEQYDISFTEAQNLREMKLEQYQDQVSSIIRECGDWYLKLLSSEKGGKNQ